MCISVNYKQTPLFTTVCSMVTLSKLLSIPLTPSLKKMEILYFLGKPLNPRAGTSLLLVRKHDNREQFEASVCYTTEIMQVESDQALIGKHVALS